MQPLYIYIKENKIKIKELAKKSKCSRQHIYGCLDKDKRENLNSMERKVLLNELEKNESLILKFNGLKTEYFIINESD